MPRNNKEKVKRIFMKPLLTFSRKGALKGCWNFPHPFDKLRTMPDLSLRSGVVPLPKRERGNSPPFWGRCPKGREGGVKLTNNSLVLPRVSPSSQIPKKQ